MGRPSNSQFQRMLQKNPRLVRVAEGAFHGAAARSHERLFVVGVPDCHGHAHDTTRAVLAAAAGTPVGSCTLSMSARHESYYGQVLSNLVVCGFFRAAIWELISLMIRHVRGHCFSQ
mmetsp:Transcript_76507/g.132333  ORF Transcript_76507/g.132333 Transcript_76507/m.132333 type:complete len:117 (-) Transcript_76507:136-486(-)